MGVRRVSSVIIAGVCVPILMFVLLFSAIQYAAFDLKFYEHEYQKLNVAAEIGIAQAELIDVTRELLAYIKAERGDLNMTAGIEGETRQVFNAREIEHMVDVQRLYLTALSARNTALVLLAALIVLVRILSGRQFVRSLAKGYLIGSGAVMVALAIIFYLVARDFLWFWTIFHEIIFTNDLWILDPETDILIQMVPEQFFLDLVVKVLVWTIIPLVLAAALFTRVLAPWRRKPETCAGGKK